MGHSLRRSRRIFPLVLIPLLLLVIMQAGLSFGSVILGGIFSSLRGYAADRLNQVAETRQIILESQMVQQWSEMSEEYDAANQMLSQFLETHRLDLEEFLADEALQEEYLAGLLPTWTYMMRKNSTTGAFLILAREGIETQGGAVNALYLRDGDPDTNPADYSDLLLAIGPSSVSQAHQIPLGINWRSRLTLKPQGERDADGFFYAPYLAALEQPTQDKENLRYWSRPFCLEDDSTDPYRMIACSIPLITAKGQVWGVMGVEISLPYLEENLPYREVDSGHRGGYLLLERTDEEHYQVVHASGPVVGQLSMDLDSLTLAPARETNLFCLSHNDHQDYLVLKPLRLYNTNTPFYDHSWFLAGVETHAALFGISDTLSRVFVIATLFSLAVAIVLAVLLVRFVTRPIRRLSDCIQNSTENELGTFSPSHIAEVDELYDTISRLTTRQKQIEYDLLEEKERYRLALQSSSDILLSYDPDQDRAVFYNLDGSGREDSVDHLLEAIRTQDYVHPDDRRILFARLAEAQTELSVSFRIDFSGQAKDYRWFDFNGRILPAGEGRPRTLIGALHNIHDQKLQETAAYESLHRDSLTGLYRRASGEDIVRSSIQAGHGGCLILLDLQGLGELNQQLGITAGNVVLEEIGHLLTAWKEIEAPIQSVLLRLGGNQFLLWLENYDRAKARQAALTLCRRAKALYSEGSFFAQFLCGCAQTRAGEPYPALLNRACRALAEAKSKNAAEPVWAEDLSGQDTPAGNVIVPIEYTAAVQRDIVPLTFALFDRGGEAGDVLSLLFPRLGRELGVCDIILSQISQDFFTVSALYQWHSADGVPKNREIVRFSAKEFAALRTNLWPGGSEPREIKTLDDAQRRFLCAPDGREGLAFPLYDSGNYMGAILFLHKPGEKALTEDKKGELLEAVKVIEVNLNRQRYDSASRAKSDFLSRMSHEIRTPMNAIIGMTYIAKTHTDDQKAVSADLDKIDQSSHYLLGLINDILDMSRIESGKMIVERTPFDLSLLLDGVGDLIRPQTDRKAIRYCLDAHIDRPWVEGDSLHLKQVLINLLGNAVKFTPEKGSVTLTVRQDSDGEVFFSVKDTGIGVSPENQERIFQSFEQAESSTVRQYGGTGLGLAISSHLVRMMGGVIQLDSVPDQGSDFYFTISLPLCRPPEENRDPDPAAANQPTAQGLRILLVEDNELNIEIAQSILEMHGAQVTLAHNGLEAVERFTASSPGDFNLILMDIQMPVMDGLTATKAIRQSDHPQAASIPIIAMTANAFDEDMKRSVSSGMNGHLSKPLDFDQVLSVIAQVVEPTP